MPALSLVVAGLNSTIKESHLDDDHYGWLGEDQLEWFAAKLAGYRDRGWLRIGAVHHNCRRNAQDDSENLRDADDLKRILIDTELLNLILHGHTHHGRLNWWTPRVPILATGSAALTPAPRPPELPNQYQILRIHREGLQQWCRAYAPESDRRGFIGDTRASKDGRDWHRGELVQWHAVDGVFPSTKEAATSGRVAEQVLDGAPTPWHRQSPGQRDPEPDDFLAEVGTVCRMRERGRVEIKRRHLDGGAFDYLAVTVSDDGLTRTYPLIAFEQGIELDALRAFIADVVARHRSRDPQTRPLVIHGAGSPPEDAAQALMQRHRLHCISFIEHQGLIDFGRYLSEQTGRLETDRIYPPRLYIPQRMDYRIGFDELAVRISYDRVTRHLETLLGAAAARHAKVVVTSRTQHFESDAQVMTALGKQVESLPRHRIGWIRRFDTTQIRAFLTRRLGDPARAERRFALINAIKDLLGLSHNPRMLAFIADLSEADLEAAKTWPDVTSPARHSPAPTSAMPTSTGRSCADAI